MKAPRTSRFSTALPVFASLAVSALTTSAFATEEWPPRTPPRVPVDTPSPAAPPAPAPPAPAPAPATTSPPPAAVPEARPSAPSPEPAVEPAPTAAVETIRVAPRTPSRGEPLAGLSESRLFVRTPGNEVVLFPGGLLQLDGRSFQTGNLSVPDTRLWLHRARPELAGWLGRAVYFDAAADFAAGASLRGVDDFVAVDPWADRAILQVGQFDAPFTLENQTRDRDLDFMERSFAVRAFAVPENKKRGAMVHGTTPARSFYYAAGGFVGDGESDVMARAWVAPFSFNDPDILGDITVGGSAWVGSATASATLPAQTTAGGVVLVDPSTRWLDGSTTTAVALRPRGRLEAVALEVNAPFRHRGGVRFEWIAKHEPLAEVSATDGGMPSTKTGFTLGGWSTYGEAWWWVLGNDRFLSPAGLELPVRLSGPSALPRPFTGLMIAARVERLDETVTAPAAAVAPTDIWSVGRTTLTTASLGVNAWLAERVRVTLGYAWNRVGGTTLYSTSFTDRNIQELSLRLALAL